MDCAIKSYKLSKFQKSKKIQILGIFWSLFVIEKNFSIASCQIMVPDNLIHDFLVVQIQIRAKPIEVSVKLFAHRISIEGIPFAYIIRIAIFNGSKIIVYPLASSVLRVFH